MSLNETPSAMRQHIGFFGRTNVGKSRLVNAVTNQSISLVSDVSGTTTDPVKKAMELSPAGPVMIVDTPGFDDRSLLGELRIKRTNEVLKKTDLAVLVTDKESGFDKFETELIDLFDKNGIAYVIARNKCDLFTNSKKDENNTVYVSAENGEGIEELKRLLAKKLTESASSEGLLIKDKISENDLIILVVPIDAAAPKGRLILPQQMVIRDILDGGGQALVVKDVQLENTLKTIGKKPRLIITDSQVFGKVRKIVPEEILLTSFSIIMARYKGFLDGAVAGARVLDRLKDGDRVLISEGCSHHRQCGDIGTQKLPAWISGYCKKSIDFSFTQGGEFPEDPSEFSLIVHCGGCMLTEREVLRRKKSAEYFGVPFTNYGTVIAHINGILNTSLKFLEL